jgi:hypothetical protein
MYVTQLSEIVAGMRSKGRECAWFLTIVYIVENYWNRDCQCRYIRGRFFYVCRTKQGRKTAPYGKLVGTTDV